MGPAAVCAACGRLHRQAGRYCLWCATPHPMGLRPGPAGVIVDGTVVIPGQRASLLYDPRAGLYAVIDKTTGATRAVYRVAKYPDQDTARRAAVIGFRAAGGV